MSIDIPVPALGESITEGRIARWLKPDGATVKADEPIFELETDKASTEIAAPSDGILRIAVKEGETVQVGTVVARIEPVSTSARKPAEEPAKDPATAARGLAPTPTPAPAPTQKPPPSPPKQTLQIQATPIAPLPRPTVVADGHPAPRKEGRESRERMSTIRKRIAERLVQSQQTTASLTTFNEADMSAIVDLRTRFKEAFQKKHGIGLGFMSFFVKAVVEALKSFPVVNSRIDGDEVVTQHFYDIGVAVSTEKGLMVPVMRDADKLSFADIEKRIVELANKAREGKINVAELQGGTFTITNGGIFGSMLSTPILNPPQSAILGMHAIQKRAVVVNDQVVIRPMMYVALTYDHRVIDGREAVQFLVRVKECIENPWLLMLEV